ncbi:hypothetical protein AYI68_g6222 [Smittium mucronatum]|uniref:Uncharacterized protein n=1 Tax=Smittium mucronatum TaxID=133383 RepID=A0A1R0GS65_9FUNG|nr:hypothetical protein AYI68_g6222 [Smittium mucronatum]
MTRFFNFENLINFAKKNVHVPVSDYIKNHRVYLKECGNEAIECTNFKFYMSDLKNSGSINSDSSSITSKSEYVSGYLNHAFIDLYKKSPHIAICRNRLKLVSIQDIPLKSDKKLDSGVSRVEISESPDSSQKYYLIDPPDIKCQNCVCTSNDIEDKTLPTEKKSLSNCDMFFSWSVVSPHLKKVCPNLLPKEKKPLKVMMEYEKMHIGLQIIDVLPAIESNSSRSGLYLSFKTQENIVRSLSKVRSKNNSPILSNDLFNNLSELQLLADNNCKSFNFFLFFRFTFSYIFRIIYISLYFHFILIYLH